MTGREGFLRRFYAILEALDEMAEGEEMEELNAQLEDALFLLESAGDDAEEIQGALEEISGLLPEYRALENAAPELSQKVLELEMAVQMAENNLEK